MVCSPGEHRSGAELAVQGRSVFDLDRLRENESRVAVAAAATASPNWLGLGAWLSFCAGVDWAVEGRFLLFSVGGVPRERASTSVEGCVSDRDRWTL